ncbi:MAG: hypothetical protein V1861_01860 [Candidatus Micrarchaeota archaeon]
MVKIDKKYIIAGIAVIAILMFLLEPFQWGSGLSKPSSSGLPTGKNVTGTAIFNGTIRTYDPIMFIPIDTNQSVIDKIRLNESVLNIQQQQNAYMIQIQTRDDVFPLASWLRGMNVTGYSIANVAVNQQIKVDTAAGEQNATVPAGVVRVVTEPMLDADSQVTVSMIAVLRDGVLIDYSSASIVLEQIDLLLDTRVESLDGAVYRYTIPWGERNSIGDLSRYGSDAVYKKVDSIVFNTPLTVSQIMTKKQFPYIVYIDAGSAQVEQTFSNVTELQTNFADTPFTLPDSILTITTNETPELNFTGSVTYRYTLSPINSSYDFGPDQIVVEGATHYDINSTVQLNISALALGDKILSIKRVSLPS